MKATLGAPAQATVLHSEGNHDMTTTVLERAPVQSSAREAELMLGRSGSPTYRTTARVVGGVYIAGFIVGIVGNGLSQSILNAPDHLSSVVANSLVLAIGALLWLTAAAGDAAHGVLMFPILKQHGERMAIGYLATRIVDAIFIAVMVLFLLLQIPLGSEYLKAAAADASALQIFSVVSIQASLYAYDLGMSAVGVAGLILCYTLYRARLVPRILAIWGLVGYAIIFGGMVSELMGSGSAWPPRFLAACGRCSSGYG